LQTEEKIFSQSVALKQFGIQICDPGRLSEIPSLEHVRRDRNQDGGTDQTDRDAYPWKIRDDPGLPVNMLLKSHEPHKTQGAKLIQYRAVEVEDR
jgi:hypothetical protein